MQYRLFILPIALGMLFSSVLYAHCQMPCGIYDDQTRIILMKENITTIEKAMNEINRLGNADKVNYNQLVRWVNTKDMHANEFSEVVSYYFLTQRIKITDPSDKEAFAKYQKQLTILHQMLVYSMKCKQTTDLENVKKLSQLVDQFVEIYFSKEDIEHLKEHH